MAIPPHYDYDVIVIGAGIGGLVCGARLAQQGLHVIVLEQHSRPGGYCTAFQTSGFTFDAAVHLIGGCSSGGIVDNILIKLGLDREIEFIKVDPLYRLIAPGRDFQLPGELHEHFAMLATQFPNERNGLTRLTTLIENVWHESVALLEAPFEQTFSLALKSQHMAALMPLTYQAVLDDFLSSPELKACLSLFCGYGGLPAERMSAMYMVSILGSYLVQGAYYPKGGSQSLANVLASGITRSGGIVRLNHPVRQIILSNGAVHGVRLENGEEITAARIVSNADAYHTFYYLLGDAQLDRRLDRQLQSMELSMSAFQVYLGVDLNLPAIGTMDHEMIVTSSYELERVYRNVYIGNWSEVAFGITMPSLLDPTLAQPNTHCVHLTLPVPTGPSFDWTTHRDELADRLVSSAERVLPGLTQNIVVREIATPNTLMRFTQNQHGVCYGWAQTPEQTSTRRLRPQTPFKGLFLAGHWTMPGGGIVAVASSGMKTAEMVIRSLEAK